MLRVEYTRLSPYVYVHRSQVNTFEHHGHWLGYWSGPNSDNFFTGIDFMPRENLWLQLFYQKTRRGEVTDETIDETIDYLIRIMPYYPDHFRNKIDYQVSINYAAAYPGTPLYEYAREHGFIGKDLDSEEAYLIKISDTDAYDTDYFINYTQLPLLKVLSWRSRIQWKLFREHAKTNLNISPSKLSILLSLLIISINQIFKTRLSSPLKKAFDKVEVNYEKRLRTQFNNYIYFQYGLKLLLPWNKFTYPFIVVLIAFKEARGLGRYVRGTLKNRLSQTTKKAV